MGQYYVVYVEDPDNGSVGVFMDDYGIKLMEQSWWDNGLCNGVASMLYKNPRILAWVGDYADDVGCKPDVYKKCWQDEDDRYKRSIKECGNKEFSLFGRYLVNHSKKEYVDCDGYYRRTYAAMRLEDRGGTIWVPHPLSILTAIGNGQGGGDYGGCLGLDKVGAWALNRISVEDEAPDGMKELDEFVLMGDFV